MWAGHLVWMEARDVGRSLGVDGSGSTIRERAEAVKQQGHRKRGRPWLRWEDC